MTKSIMIEKHIEKAKKNALESQVLATEKYIEKPSLIYYNDD